MSTPKTRKTKNDGSAKFSCRYCKTEDVEEFKVHKSLCQNCLIDRKAVKLKNEDKKKRIGAIKLIMEEFETVSQGDEITYSEIPTGTLLNMAREFKDLMIRIKNCEKTMEKQRKEIEKLRSK